MNFRGDYMKVNVTAENIISSKGGKAKLMRIFSGIKMNMIKSAESVMKYIRELRKKAFVLMIFPR